MYNLSDDVYCHWASSPTAHVCGIVIEILYSHPTFNPSVSRKDLEMESRIRSKYFHPPEDVLESLNFDDIARVIWLCNCLAMV